MNIIDQVMPSCLALSFLTACSCFLSNSSAVKTNVVLCLGVIACQSAVALAASGEKYGALGFEIELKDYTFVLGLAAIGLIPEITRRIFGPAIVFPPAIPPVVLPPVVPLRVLRRPPSFLFRERN